MSHLWQKSVGLACRFPRFRRAIRNRRARQLAIVMYHGVVNERLPIFNWCQADLSRFEEQIQWLALEYRIFALQEMVDRLVHGLPLPEKAVAITFDDGFRSVYTTAYPVLQRCQAPFTVFLITSLIGTQQLTWPDQFFNALMATRADSVNFAGREWPLITPEDRRVAYTSIGSRLKEMHVDQKDDALELLLGSLGPSPAVAPALSLMSWEEVRHLAHDGLADFGSHTHTHPILSRCDAAYQKRELCESRQVLLQQLGRADLFAYPNGTRSDFTDMTKALLRELCYSCAVTTIHGLNSTRADVYELCRINVGADANLARFEALMLGL